MGLNLTGGSENGGKQNQNNSNNSTNLSDNKLENELELENTATEGIGVMGDNPNSPNNPGDNSIALSSPFIAFSASTPRYNPSNPANPGSTSSSSANPILPHQNPSNPSNPDNIAELILPPLSPITPDSPDNPDDPLAVSRPVRSSERSLSDEKTSYSSQKTRENGKELLKMKMKRKVSYDPVSLCLCLLSLPILKKRKGQNADLQALIAGFCGDFYMFFPPKDQEVLKVAVIRVMEVGEVPGKVLVDLLKQFGLSLSGQ